MNDLQIIKERKKSVRQILGNCEINRFYCKKKKHKHYTL